MLANDDSWAKDLLIDAPHQAHLGEVRCQLDLRVKSRLADIFVPPAIFGSAFNMGVHGLALTPSDTWPGSYERVGFVLTTRGSP
jgi:hypothetical protein